MRQAEILIGERDAAGVKHGIGMIETGLAGEELLQVPDIPEFLPDIGIARGDGEGFPIVDVDDRGPGHDDDQQRHDDEEG